MSILRVGIATSTKSGNGRCIETSNNDTFPVNGFIDASSYDTLSWDEDSKDESAVFSKTFPKKKDDEIRISPVTNKSRLRNGVTIQTFLKSKKFLLLRKWL